MTNFQSKHVTLLKNKKDCADVYCVTLIELQAHRNAFIQNTILLVHKNSHFMLCWEIFGSNKVRTRWSSSVRFISNNSVSIKNCRHKANWPGITITRSKIAQKLLRADRKNLLMWGLRWEVSVRNVAGSELKWERFGFFIVQILLLRFCPLFLTIIVFSLQLSQCYLALTTNRSQEMSAMCDLDLLSEINSVAWWQFSLCVLCSAVMCCAVLCCAVLSWRCGHNCRTADVPGD